MICEKGKCTGCFACYNICPKGAIEMREDEFGFIYPKIIESKCINCGLCKKICPSINNVPKKEPLKCYAMYSKEKNIRSKSTSGGVATQISKIFIENDGVVYGAVFEENCIVIHKRITTIKELDLLQGSKYVHSYIYDTYKQVKNDLTNDKKVLFIGTPCQIAGLKNYLMKNYEKLYLIDIICHGVPSQKYLKEEVFRLSKSKKIDRVNFRKNNNYGFYIMKNRKCIYEAAKEKSPYADSFMIGISLRDNCQHCSYADKKRISDITIGDFWGLNKNSKLYQEKENGICTVICVTEKGQSLVNKIKDYFEFEVREYSESVAGNTQLRCPINKYKEAQKFKKDYLKYGFNKAYKKNTKKIRLKRKLSKIKKKVKKLIKNEQK